ncbi:MAG: B12-binding domain-containing radical SAM protein [Deltaproteobacteria bacterium]|nr:B12-binding domain-containing radical SAM protein [Deltaproteobacteria bacterium]
MRILLVVYDNDSYIHYFPSGLAYIASVLIREGYEVEIYNQDQHHFPDNHLTEFLDKNKYDAIGVGVIGGYYQYRKLLNISNAINNSRNRPFYMIGGHGPSPEPEYFLKKTQADVVVIGEGEITVVNLMNALGNHKSLKTIKGIAFREGDNVIVNERQPLIKDIDTISFPAYDLFPIDYYRLLKRPRGKSTDFQMPVLSSRGCTFKCNFCYRMDKGYRKRGNESIIEEIKLLKEKYGIKIIQFSDELLMFSEERAISICESLIKADLNIKWLCAGRLNYAKPNVLKLMRRAGCVYISYGIEAMSDRVLKNMNKKLTTKQIVDGIKATLDVGISPGFNIIFGNIGEDKSTLNRGVEFLLKYDDGAELRTIRPVTPYPGSPLYYYAIEKGLLKDCEDFYENKHINSDLLSVNFTDMSDDEFHKSLMDANTRLITNYYQKRASETIEQSKLLYSGRDASFRGFRQT